MRLLIGNLGASNVGDELLLYAFLKIYGYENSVVMTHNKHRTNTFLDMHMPCISFPAMGIRSTIKHLLKPINEDIYDITEVHIIGGGLFAGSKKSVFMRTYAYILWYGIIKKILHKYKNAVLYMHHMGIDMPSNIIEMQCLKGILRHCTSISVRDNVSLKVVNTLGYSAINKGDTVHYMLTNSLFTPTKRIIPHPYNIVQALHTINKASLDTINSDNIPCFYMPFDDTDRHYKPLDMPLLEPTNAVDTLNMLYYSDNVYAMRYHPLLIKSVFNATNTYIIGDPYSSKVRILKDMYNIQCVL